MSKRGYISRYMMLIKRLKGKPFSTFEELEKYVVMQLANLHMQDDTLVMGFSKRTLQRDIREIRTLFGIDITYNTSRKGYHINSNEYESSGFQRMMEAFDIFNSLNLTRDMESLILVEPRKPAGTDHMYGLLQAIKNNVVVKFQYHKFWNDEVKLRSVEPYLLKEFRNRWYVITIGANNNEIKTFALDRITDLEITAQKFSKNKDVNVKEVFQHSFGIITGNGKPPLDVILSFSPFQGKYIKSLPLHTSQTTLIDDDKEFRIALKLHLTVDLLMEIQSFGENVQVIEPTVLKNQVNESLKKTLSHYSN